MALERDLASAEAEVRGRVADEMREVLENMENEYEARLGEAARALDKSVELTACGSAQLGA